MIREKRNYISQNLIINKDFIIPKDDFLKSTESEYEREERLKKKRFVRNLLRDQDKELREKQRWEQVMVCPECHFSLPRSGICDCGYSI